MSLVVCAATAAFAQAAGSAGDSVVRVQVNVVDMFFTVTDAHNRFVEHLAPGEFELTENGASQQIRYFSDDPNQSLYIALLIDNSPSQARLLKIEQTIGAEFIADVMRPQDESMLVTFGRNARVIQQLTHDLSKMEASLARIEIGDPHQGIADAHAGRGLVRTTILNDTVHMVAEQELENENGRKAMVVLTDGVDEGSQLDVKAAIRAAHVAGAICYIVLITDHRYYVDRSMVAKGESDMKKLAGQTGGRVIRVSNNAQQLKIAFNRISEDLRHQYSIGYISTDQRLDGSFRKVKIQSRHRYHVLCRAGYYARP